MRTLALLSLALCLVTGCPVAAPECPPDGRGFSESTRLYCVYGVVVGGFRGCPAGLPNRFDFADGSFVCSDHPIGSRDMIPRDVCAALPACAASASTDAGRNMDAAIPVDAALPSTPFACGSGSCAAGQVCVTTELAFLPDVGPNDAGFSGMCVTRPSACGSQGDCSLSSCIPPCVDAICDPIPGYQTAMLVVSGDGLYYSCLLMSDTL